MSEVQKTFRNTCIRQAKYPMQLFRSIYYNFHSFLVLDFEILRIFQIRR